MFPERVDAFHSRLLRRTEGSRSFSFIFWGDLFWGGMWEVGLAGARLRDLSITDLPFHLLLTAIQRRVAAVAFSSCMSSYVFQMASSAPRLSKRVRKPTAKSAANAKRAAIARSAPVSVSLPPPVVAGGSDMLADIQRELLSLRTQVASMNSVSLSTSGHSSSFTPTQAINSNIMLPEVARSCSLLSVPSVRGSIPATPILYSSPVAPAIPSASYPVSTPLALSAPFSAHSAN